MRITRIRVEGFGALRDLDLSWPEGSVLLAVDPNETGKTTLCEAIVTALYGLPKRGNAARVKEMRRPRSGAPMRVGLDVTAGGRLWAIDRDLEAGTLRIVDRDRGFDATHEFLRPGVRDAFGETVTGGLSEALFRATAYVKQNVLDTDRLEAGLTVELARIADSGGGEGSVVRALAALEAVRREMPGSTTGAAVAVETEVARLTRKIEALRIRRDVLAARRRQAAQASAALAHRTRVRDEARRRAALADLAVVASERRALAARLEVARAASEKREELESEALSLAPEAALFSDEALREVDRLREERGTRPQALEAARTALDASLREAGRDAGSFAHRFGPAARLTDEERSRLETLLRTLEALRREQADVEAALEERTALELEGVKLDRKVADASAVAAIVAGERAQRVKIAKGMTAAAGALVPVVAWSLWPAADVPVYFAASLAVFAATLGLFGAIGWGRGGRGAAPRARAPPAPVGREAEARPGREGRGPARREHAPQGPPAGPRGGGPAARADGGDFAARRGPGTARRAGRRLRAVPRESRSPAGRARRRGVGALARAPRRAGPRAAGGEDARGGAREGERARRPRGCGPEGPRTALPRRARGRGRPAGTASRRGAAVRGVGAPARGEVPPAAGA